MRGIAADCDCDGLESCLYIDRPFKTLYMIAYSGGISSDKVLELCDIICRLKNKFQTLLCRFFGAII